MCLLPRTKEDLSPKRGFPLVLGHSLLSFFNICLKGGILVSQGVFLVSPMCVGNQDGIVGVLIQDDIPFLQHMRQQV